MRALLWAILAGTACGGLVLGVGVTAATWLGIAIAIVSIVVGCVAHVRSNP
jgi:hypothetical protein